MLYLDLFANFALLFFPTVAAAFFTNAILARSAFLEVSVCVVALVTVL